MLTPLSWLKEYVKIDTKPNKLGEKLTEVGLGTEKISKLDDGDILFDFEITPNRPDLLSVLGIAREIAAVEKNKVTYEASKQELIPKTNPLSIEIINDLSLCPRYTAIIVKNVHVTQSPEYIKERLTKVNLHPICNLVDITNYVMLMLGNPLHVFDYDKISGHYMKLMQAKGGEEFISLDGKKYHLPKGTIIIKDHEKIIDLCGIKGGLNTSVDENTKNILIHIPIYPGFKIRKTSQELGLSSDASRIYERGANKSGTIITLKTAVELVLKNAGGEIASSLIDYKEKDISEKKIKISSLKLSGFLGKQFSNRQISEIIGRLGINTSIKNKDEIEINIPGYRLDLNIEEDIYEEIARVYGYNNFPKTIPTGTSFPTTIIPYFKDYNLEHHIKEILRSAGFYEIYTYSLLSENSLSKLNIKEKEVLRIDNPVSQEFEYLRPNLSANLLNALSSNIVNEKDKIFKLFEIGTVYVGQTIDNFKEKNQLAIISNKFNFFKTKGVIQRLFFELNLQDKIKFNKNTHNESFYEVNKNAEIFYEDRQIGKIGMISSDVLQNFGINQDVSYCQLDYSIIENLPKLHKAYRPIPKYPPIVEDISMVLNQEYTYDQIVTLIRKQSSLISKVILVDTYKNKITLRLIYQDPEKNLTNEEISIQREKIYKALEKELKSKIM